MNNFTEGKVLFQTSAEKRGKKIPSSLGRLSAGLSLNMGLGREFNVNFDSVSLNQELRNYKINIVHVSTQSLKQLLEEVTSINITDYKKY